MVKTPVRTFFSITLIITAVSGLSACSPVYELHYRYHPPQDDAGRSCIRNCEGLRNSCIEDCTLQVQQCKLAAREKAMTMLPEREKEYLNELEAYLTARESYELKRERWRSERERLQQQYDELTDLCNRYPSEKKYCSDKRSKSFQLSRHGWKEPKNAPKRPDKPSYSTELQRQHEDCESDCNCNQRFDGCYTSCGGQIEAQQICVKHCE